MNIIASNPFIVINILQLLCHKNHERDSKCQIPEYHLYVSDTLYELGFKKDIESFTIN